MVRPAAGRWRTFQQAGARREGRQASEQWFAAKKHFRKIDEVQRYLQHARNADEHGIGGTDLAYAEIEVLAGEMYDPGFAIIESEPRFRPVGNKDFKYEVRRALKLKPVVDRGVAYFPPGYDPTAENKVLISAIDVADAGLAQLRTMLDEAAQLKQSD